MKSNLRFKVNKICTTLKSTNRLKLHLLEEKLVKEMQKFDAEAHLKDNIVHIQDKINELQQDLHLVQAEISEDTISKRILTYYSKSETVSKYFLSFGHRNPKGGLFF